MEIVYPSNADIPENTLHRTDKEQEVLDALPGDSAIVT